MFVLASVVVTWPLPAHLNSLIIDKEDGLLLTWILNWSIDHPLSYDANIFYPNTKTLAYSETMLPLALIAGPIVKLFNEPLLAYNLSFLLGFILSGFVFYLLLQHISHDGLRAFLLAVMFNFSALRLTYIDKVQIQLFNLWPLLLAIFFLYRRQKAGFIFFFVISSLTSVLFFYFLAVIWAVEFMVEKGVRPWLIRTAFVGCVLVLPFVAPYLQVSKEFNYVRPIRDAIHFSLVPSDLLTFGIGFWVVALLTLARLRDWRRLDVFDKRVFFLALAGLVLALGPAMHFVRETVRVGPLPAIPLPYAVLYYVVPGFAGFRAPFRWALLFGIFIFVAAARTFKIGKPVLVVLAVLTIFEIKIPFRYEKVPPYSEFPKEQIWLRDNYKGRAVIQFPIYNWGDYPGRTVETAREYFSTAHYHPMVNGFSGFSPADWQAKVYWLQREFPNDETLSYLEGIGVKLVLMPVTWKAPVDRLRLVKKFENTSVYELF